MALRLDEAERLELYTVYLSSINEAIRTFGSINMAQVWMAGAIVWLSSGQVPTHSQLADMTGLSRRTVGRIVKQLRADGFLQMTDGEEPTAKGTEASTELASSLFEILTRLKPICVRLDYGETDSEPE